MSERVIHTPRLWHLPRAGRHGSARLNRVLVGRQGIFRADRSLYGYELLFRAPGRVGLRVDLWNSRQQNRATEHVLAAAFNGGVDISNGLPLFVNFTDSYLTDEKRHYGDPASMIIEVVESTHAEESLRDRLYDLKQQGFRIAVDDFIGTTSQMGLLDLADYVKIDYRDLTQRGAALVAMARQHNVTLIAERLETPQSLIECIDSGFDLFQGHLFEPAIIVERHDLASSRMESFTIRNHGIDL